MEFTSVRYDVRAGTDYNHPFGRLLPTIDHEDILLLPKIPNLEVEVWTLVRQIPGGRVATYGDIARAMGDVSASRFVGEVMMNHDHNDQCVCHRVVRSDGTLGKFISGVLADKQVRLENEQVQVVNEAVVLGEFGFNDFSSDAPLFRLKEYQDEVAQSVEVTQPLNHIPDRIGGIDVSFVPNSNRGVAAFVEVDVVNGTVVYSRMFEDEIRFPYVSGYLAYRELPLLQTLLTEVIAERELPVVTLVDGSGVLHPRRAGVGAMLGVAMGMRTIGVTKKHLIGKVDISGLTNGESREIHVGDGADEHLAGFAMLPGSGTMKPIYISPGHLIDAQSSLAVLQRCLLGRRLPEPIYWADRLSRDAT